MVKEKKTFVRIMTLTYFFEENTSGIATVIKASNWRFSKFALYSKLLEDMGLVHGRVLRATEASTPVLLCGLMSN